MMVKCPFNMMRGARRRGRRECRMYVELCCCVGGVSASGGGGASAKRERFDGFSFWETGKRISVGGGADV